jgi:hypothetical protein
MIYVHGPFPTRKTKQWPFKHAFHLLIDKDSDVEELHVFAVNILGLRREWFQDRPGLPHYDIVLSKYGVALANGAARINNRGLVELCKRETTQR